MAIKSTGQAPPVRPTADVDATKGATSAGKNGGPSFASAVQSTASGGAPETAPLRSAVAEVAQKVRASELPAEHAVDEVIERMVREQLPSADSRTVRARVNEAQAVLGANPVFIDQLSVLFREHDVSISS